MSEHWTESELISNIVGFALSVITLCSILLIFIFIADNIRNPPKVNMEIISESFEDDEEMLKLFFDDFGDEDIL